MIILKNSDVGSSERCISLRTSFRQVVIRLRGIEKTACKVEKMFESHDRLCKFEICFLRVGSVGSVNDNGVTKLRKIVSHGRVERDFALLD